MVTPDPPLTIAPICLARNPPRLSPLLLYSLITPSTSSRGQTTQRPMPMLNVRYISSSVRPPSRWRKEKIGGMTAVSLVAGALPLSRRPPTGLSSLRSNLSRLLSPLLLLLLLLFPVRRVSFPKAPPVMCATPWTSCLLDRLQGRPDVDLRRAKQRIPDALTQAHRGAR